MGVGKIRADKITTDIGNTLLSERTVDSSPDDAMVTRSYYKSNFVDKITNIENQAAEFSRHIDARLADMQARIDRLKLRLVEVNRLTIEKITGSVERTRQDITNTLTNEVNKARTDITNLNNSTWNGVKDEIARRLDQNPRKHLFRMPTTLQHVYPGSSIHMYRRWFAFGNEYGGWSKAGIIYEGYGASADRTINLYDESGAWIRVELSKSGTTYTLRVKLTASGPEYNPNRQYIYRDRYTNFNDIIWDSRDIQVLLVNYYPEGNEVLARNGVVAIPRPSVGGDIHYFVTTGYDSSHTQNELFWFASRFEIEVNLRTNQIRCYDSGWKTLFY